MISTDRNRKDRALFGLLSLLLSFSLGALGQVCAGESLPSRGPAIYRVEPGDTLTGIAADHGLTVRALARLNGIAPDSVLQVGEALRVSASPQPASAARPPSRRPTLLYRVQPGDTLTGIAADHGLTVQALARLNGIASDSVLQVGQLLRVPGARVPASAVRPPSRRPLQLYRVQPGNTLTGIAANHGLTVQALARLNGVAPDSGLQVGELLRVPAMPSPARTPAVTRPARRWPTQLYRVQPGDTLTSLAAEYRLSVQSLARLNGIAPDDVLPVGALLRVPRIAVPKRSAGRFALRRHGAFYRVQPGDTLSGIAAQYGLSARALARLNHIPPAVDLRVGQRLRVPAVGSHGPVLAFGPLFPCPPALRPAVDFWIRVFTQITTNEGFLHDPNDLGVIYETVRFAPGTSRWERQQVVNRARDRLAAELRRIAAGVRPLTAQEQRIRALWGPDTSAARLLRAANDIRFQLGQSNRFRDGLIRSGAWQHAIARALARQGLPPQLAALPLVESSYNPRAYSKDGAAGIWQFMPGTAQPFLRMNAAIDQRMDPFSATVAAAQLLAYNHRILGTWPLAITAYNHGLAGMMRAVRVMGTKNIADIVLHYRTPMFGFASRNFYVSFLAALYVDEHARHYFGVLHRLPEEHYRALPLPGYVSMPALENVLGVPLSRLRALNPALLPPVWDGELDVPKGYRLRLPSTGPVWTVADLVDRLGAPAFLSAQVRPPSYRVQWGDTLSGIAARYGLSVWELAQFNGIQPNGILRVGERLSLPGAPQPAPLLADNSGPAPNALTRYVVQPGDTLSGIAAQFGVSLWALAQINDIQPNGILRVGERLRLPGAAQPLLAQNAGPMLGALPRSYVVQPGDTLSGIAAQFGVNLWALAQFNDIQPNGILQVGERLRLPGAAQPLLAQNAGPVLGALPTSYVVQPGDTLSGIAAQFGVSMWVLARLNHIQANGILSVGERLRLPQAAGASPLPAGIAAAGPRPAPVDKVEAQGPGLGPGGHSAPTIDPTDYSVAANGTIRVASQESLGYYAEWLGVSAAELRRINHLPAGQPLQIGEEIRLDFRHVTPAQFEQQRVAYHRAIEASYFATHRITGTFSYVTRSGDSLWTLVQRFPALPEWLLRQYNPHVDFFALTPGTRLIIPRVVSVAAGS